MNRRASRGSAPRSAKKPGKKSAKAPRATPRKQPVAPTQPTEPKPPIRLGFVRGVTPSKWAERWRRVVPNQPIELIPVSLYEVADARESSDVLLERVAPGSAPEATQRPNQTRHAVRLYEENVALVIDTDHELASRAEVDLEDLSLVKLLSHPDHDGRWPTAEPWQDTAWAPKDASATLELVATGLGGALLPQPLARHLAGKRTHAVVPVARNGASLLPGTEIWASWSIDRDTDDVQHLIGLMRGRTARSSRS